MYMYAYINIYEHDKKSDDYTIADMYVNAFVSWYIMYLYIYSSMYIYMYMYMYMYLYIFVYDVGYSDENSAADE